MASNNEFNFMNYKALGPTCYNLKFYDKSFTQSSFKISGRHQRGKVNLELQTLELQGDEDRVLVRFE